MGGGDDKKKGAAASWGTSTAQVWENSTGRGRREALPHASTPLYGSRQPGSRMQRYLMGRFGLKENIRTGTITAPMRRCSPA